MLVASLLNRGEIELQFVVTTKSVVAGALVAIDHHLEFREFLGRQHFLLINFPLRPSLLSLVLN